MSMLLIFLKKVFECTFHLRAALRITGLICDKYLICTGDILILSVSQEEPGISYVSSFTYYRINNCFKRGAYLYPARTIFPLPWVSVPSAEGQRYIKEKEHVALNLPASR